MQNSGFKIQIHFARGLTRLRSRHLSIISGLDDSRTRRGILLHFASGIICPERESVNCQSTGAR